MNVMVALVIGYLLLGLELGIREGLRLWPTNISPSFVLPFIVLVALFAPTTPALWTGLLLGLAVDLSTQRGPELTVVIGPHALGYMVAAYFVNVARALVFRRNRVTLVVLSIFAACVANIVALALLALRKIIYADPIALSTGDELLQRFASSVFTGLTAILIAFAIFPLLPALGLHDPASRRFSKRS